MDLLIGLDVGTTATKALLFDLSGRILASAAQPYDLLTPKPGWVEQDPEALWKAVCATLHALSRYINPGDRVLALAQSSQGGTTIPTNLAGQPTANAISWMDGRTYNEMKAFQEGFGAEGLYQLTGWPLIAGLPLMHIAWMRANNPASFANTRRFLFVNDFIGLRLTGEYCMNPSDASITQLLNIETCDWDERLLEWAGIESEMLSDVRNSGTVLGELTRSASAATGLPAGTLVVNGAHDQYCTSVALGVTRPGPMQLSCGTAWVILTVPQSLEIGLSTGMAISCHAVPKRWGAIRSLGGVGTCMEWMVNQLWARSVETDRELLFSALNNAVERTAPGANGLVFIPLAGGHAESFGLNRGGFLRMTLTHTLEDMSRALMEGIACELRWALEEIRQAGVQVSELKLVGGGSKSSPWRQIVADVTGVPVKLPAMPQAAAWGAAILAGVGATVYASVEAAQAKTVEEQHISPNNENRACYEDLFEQYKELCPVVSRVP
jgi:xylulokinase